MVIDNLYNNVYDNVGDASVVFSNEVLEDLLKRLYEKEFNPLLEIDKNSWNVFWDMYNKAVDEGFKEYSWNIGDEDFKKELKYNNGIFAAFKTHRFQNDVAAQLTDADGNLKPFRQFEQDVKDIIAPRHLESWLQTEYNTAAIRARQTAQWKRFEENADIFPNLKWIESISPNPGEDHRIFWGVIRPLADDFWNHHRPGDRWNCKCDLEATAEEPTPREELPKGENKDKPAAGLEGNPGKDGKLFSDTHPYIKNAAPGAEKAVKRFIKENLAPLEEYKRKTYKSGGFVETPKIGEQNKVEEKKNLKAYTELAKLHGEQYRLLPVSNEQGKKNPDAFNVKKNYESDVKVPITDNGKNAIQASIAAASKQRVSEAFIYLEKEYSRLDIKRGLMAALQPGRALSIKDIIIRYNTGEVQFFETDHLRYIYKKIKRK